MSRVTIKKEFSFKLKTAEGVSKVSVQFMKFNDERHPFLFIDTRGRGTVSESIYLPIKNKKEFKKLLTILKKAEHLYDRKR